MIRNYPGFSQGISGAMVARDQQGFILTGPDLPAGTGHRWPPAARRCR